MSVTRQTPTTIALLLLALAGCPARGPKCETPLPSGTKLRMGFCPDGPKGYCLYDVYADT
jgi:hypothetical protein